MVCKNEHFRLLVQFLVSVAKVEPSYKAIRLILHKTYWNVQVTLCAVRLRGSALLGQNSRSAGVLHGFETRHHLRVLLKQPGELALPVLNLVLQIMQFINQLSATQKCLCSCCGSFTSRVLMKWSNQADCKETMFHEWKESSSRSAHI